MPLVVRRGSALLMILLSLVASTWQGGGWGREDRRWGAVSNCKLNIPTGKKKEG